MLKGDVLFISGSLRRGSYNTALLREPANALASGVDHGLKNAVDWASRPFPDNPWRDKPVAVIGASTGIFGAVWAQAQLRKSLGSAEARAFLASGALRDPGLATGLRDVVAALVDAQPEREPELAGRAAAQEGG